jgi:nucleoside-diphosphate-sugar epimerase
MSNVTGTLHMLEAARWLRVKQFVFASSSSVYGLNPRVPWREDGCGALADQPICEHEDDWRASWPGLRDLYGMRFIALRFFTVYGPRQRPRLPAGSSQVMCRRRGRISTKRAPSTDTSRTSDAQGVSAFAEWLRIARASGGYEQREKHHANGPAAVHSFH